MVEQFTDYGRIAADDLRTLCLSIPADSDTRRSAQATLNEASRRLYLSPPNATRQAAAHRAQNIARLVQGLLRATGQVREEQAAARASGRPAQLPARRRRRTGAPPGNRTWNKARCRRSVWGGAPSHWLLPTHELPEREEDEQH
jgi:hypothetical protein